MDITQVATSPGGTPAGLGTRTIVTPVGDPPLRVFHQVLFVRFATGGLAEQISMIPETTVLQGRFGPYDYDALNTDITELKAHVERLGGDGLTLVVELDAPRRVTQVRLRSGKVTASGFKLEFYRLDGETVAEQPTAVATNVIPTAEIAPGLGNGFALAQARAVVNEPVQQASAFGFEVSTRFSVDFTDARFAVRLKNASGSPVSLHPADLTEIRIRSLPSGPRLGIAPAGQPDAPVFFTQLPGEISADAGHVDAGTELAVELDRVLSRLAEDSPGTLPAEIDAALVIEADAPCVFETTAFNIGFHLIQASFLAGVEKQVLRFDGGQMTRQMLNLALPTGAQIIQATVRIDASFGKDRPIPGNGPLPNSALAQKTGALVDADRWLARSITPAQAISVTGVAIGLAALVNGAELQVEIREDLQGGPAGSILAGGRLQLGGAGQRGWYTLRFNDPIILASRPHWLLIRGASGRAVWLADTTADTVRILIRSGNSASWKEERGLEGLAVLYRLLSRGTQTAVQPVFGVAIGGHEVAPPDGAAVQSGQSIELTAALNAYLQESGGEGTVPVVFTSTVPGLLTVYPPRLEYDL